MASLTEVYENFSGNQENENNENMESEPHSHEHTHEHTHDGNHENNIEAENDNMLDNENDLNQEMNVNDEMVDNLENDEIEIPDMDDSDNIESFQGENQQMGEIKESSQQIDMYKIMLFIGVPVILAALLYFLVPIIRKRFE